MTTAVSASLRLRRESTLRSRAARGDAAAFTAVYERHHQALYRYCRSILRHEEDAQDALQNTMTRAFAALQDEERDFELKPWLFRIAHNEAISILRKRRATAELDDIPVLQELDDQVSEREQLRLLAMDLADLPDRQRAALVLRELNGLSHAEIAVVLETSPANVKQTIYEARTALFSAREGREMPCDDVRRMLSDGDGRVLRGRGVRAHLRTCAACRAFRDDIGAREKRLALLAPPLPTAGAAALLAEILGGGTAAKLLACVAIAGGGATVAATAEFYKPPPRAAEAAVVNPHKPQPPRGLKPISPATPTGTTVPAVATTGPTGGEKAARGEKPAKATGPKRRGERPEKTGRVPAPTARGESAPGGARGEERRQENNGRGEERRQENNGRGEERRQENNGNGEDKPAKEKNPKSESPQGNGPDPETPAAEKPEKVKNPKAESPQGGPNAEIPKPKNPKSESPQGNNVKGADPEPTSTPLIATPTPETVPSGQAKKEAGGQKVPPGQAKVNGSDKKDD